MNREIIAILRGVMPDEILSIAEAIWEAADDRGCAVSAKPR